MQFDGLIIAWDAMAVKQFCMTCIAWGAMLSKTVELSKRRAAPVYKDIGAVIKRLREDRRMSLEDLAGSMQYPKGGDPSGLQRLESGGKRVYLDLYVQIASAFGIPLSDIIREAETKDDRKNKILSPSEEKTVVRYLCLSDSAKGAVDYIIAATLAGDQKTGGETSD